MKVTVSPVSETLICPVGEIVAGRFAACDIGMFVAAEVVVSVKTRLAVLAEDPSFAAAVTVTVPLPVPPVADRVIQGLEELIVQP